MELIYWSVGSSCMRGEDGVKGAEELNHYFSQLRVHESIKYNENLVQHPSNTKSIQDIFDINAHSFLKAKLFYN